MTSREFIVPLFLVPVLASAQLLLPIVGGREVALTPIDSPGAGTYSSTQSVTLSDPTAAAILYTTNGSTPACPATGTLYTGAFNISVTTTLKAIGCNGVTGGGVLTSIYTITGGGGAISFIAQTNASGEGPGAVSTTIPALNVLSGDKLIVYCRSGGANNTFTVTDTAGDTFSTTAHENDANVGNTQIQYLANAAANASEAFTCTNNNSASSLGIVVFQFRGGAASSILDQQLQGSTSSVSSITTGSFSTAAANEVTVLCSGTTSPSAYTAGLIGGVTATLQADSSNFSQCEYVIWTSTKSSITAAVSQTSTAWNWSEASFK